MTDDLRPDKYYKIITREVKNGVRGKLTVLKYEKKDGTWDEKELSFIPEKTDDGRSEADNSQPKENT